MLNFKKEVSLSELKLDMKYYENRFQLFETLLNSNETVEWLSMAEMP